MPYPFDNVCISCQVQYKTEKGGVYVVEMASFGPYKIWLADLKKCPKCGHLIIGGFGNHPVAFHFEEGFSETLKECMTSENGCYLLLEYKGDRHE